MDLQTESTGITTHSNQPAASLLPWKLNATTQTDLTQVNSIQALRGISAFMVVGYHWQAMLNHVYAQQDLGYILFLSGFIGVDVFFVVSGFVMVLVTRENAARQPAKFLLKRLFRVAPLAWLALLLWYFLRGGSMNAIFHNAPILWYGLAFILPGGDAPQFGRGLLDVVWTLTYELTFYGLFALAMRISGFYRSLIASMLIITLTLTIQVLLTGNWTLDPSAAPVYNGTIWPQTMISVLANPLLLEFIPGMWLAELYMRLPRRAWLWPRYFGLLAIVVFSAVYLNHPTIPNRVLMCGPWALLLVSGLVLWERLGALQVPDWLIHLGTLSYGIYLFHYPVESLLDTIWPMRLFFPTFVGVQKFMLYSACLLVVCTLLHWLVERPCIRLGYRLTKQVQHA